MDGGKPRNTRRKAAPSERMSAAEYRDFRHKGKGKGDGQPRRFALPPEHRLQVEVADWLRLALPVERCLETVWFSIDHAAAASRMVGYWRKRRGVVAGIPDLLVLHRGRAIWIELKADSSLSDDQVALRDRLLAAGSW